MADYVVDVYVPVAIRIENADSPEMAAHIAADKAYEPTGPLGEPRKPSIYERIQALVDEDIWTDFGRSDSEVQTEVGEA